MGFGQQRYLANNSDLVVIACDLCTVRLARSRNVAFYAIAEDDSRTLSKVAPLARGKGWNFTVLLDKNQDLKRELNFANIPYTVVIKNGKIIYRRIGYVTGNEFELLAVIKANQ